jgi:tyrosinase
MVDRFTSDPLELPELGQDDLEDLRADLIFYGVDHSGSSFQARVYLDAPDADASSGRDHPGYAGEFYVFGHGGCFGDEGHCDVPTEPVDPFDMRDPHPLTPQTKIVTITESLRRHVDLTKAEQSVRVTVVAETVRDRRNDVLAFDTVRLAFYT